MLFQKLLGLKHCPRRTQGIFLGKYTLLAARVPCVCSRLLTHGHCDAGGHSRRRGGGGRGPPPPAAAARRALLPAPSLSRRPGPHVLQELLAVGGRAMLVDDGLRLPQQDVREQDAACFEHPCETANAGSAR